MARTHEGSLAARDLYAGNHWAAAVQLPTLAQNAGWQQVALWIASAGYGLLASTTSVVPYGATFGPGHADSVIGTTDSRTRVDQALGWWADVADARGTAETIAAIAAETPNASFLVVASKAYVDAMSADLVEGLASLRSPERTVVVTGEDPRHTALHANTVLGTAAMQRTVGGPLTALHARIAHALTRRLRPADWNVDAARDVASQLASDFAARNSPVRSAMTDADVMMFVRARLRTNSTTSATRLLRELRDSGRACEQKRFNSLYRQAKETPWQPRR